MALNFAGLPIPGINFDPDLDPPALETVRTHYAGLDGVTEVQLGRGGRYIRYEVELFDRSFTTAADVVALLKKFDQRVGIVGDLVESGNISRRFRNCTFEGCKPLHAPIPDHARTLVPNVVAYHCRAVLVWYQLTIEDD